MRQEICSICERVRFLRTQKGVSIIELAGRTGLSHSAIYYIESKKKEPTLSSLYKIAEALDINILDLLGNETIDNQR